VTDQPAQRKTNTPAEIGEIAANFVFAIDSQALENRPFSERCAYRAELATKLQTLFCDHTSALQAESARLREALKWALPLAQLALETHRLERLRCGHSDIRGVYVNGTQCVGLWQDEIDRIEQARAALQPEPK
jgi:hypothetical protein